MTCLASCTRQENPVSTFTYKFPNKMFLQSEDLFLLIRKLSWSCRNTPTRFGPKRSFLEIDFPKLCGFFDQYVYNNQGVNEHLESDKPLTSNETLSKFLRDIKIPVTDWETWKKSLLLYATNNMVKITAYIESPYVTVFETSQVTLSFVSRSHSSNENML